MAVFVKEDIAVRIQTDLDLTTAKSKKIAQGLIDFYINAIREHKRIIFRKMGVIAPMRKKARPGRNPKTLEPHTISERISYGMRKTGYSGEHCSTANVHLSDAITHMVENHGLTPAYAHTLVHWFMRTLKETLDEGGRAEFRGFGSFTKKVYESRKQRNPATNTVGAAKAVTSYKFRLSKLLKDELKCA